MDADGPGLTAGADVAVIPDDDGEFAAAVAEALDAAGRDVGPAIAGEAHEEAAGTVADRAQERLRGQYPHADVLLEPAGSPGAPDRDRVTAYRDGAEGA